MQNAAQRPSDAARERNAVEQKSFGGRYGSSQRAPRRSNIELLRILSMLLIVLHHYACRGRTLYPGDVPSFERFFQYALMQVGALGDDLFVLISGYFLIERPFSLRRILRLWGEVFFYSVTVTLIGWAVSPPEGGVNLNALVSMAAPCLTGKYWFVTAYILLALLSPFLNRMLRALTRREFGWLLLLLFVSVSVLPTFMQGFMGWSQLATFILLYCVAGYMRLYPDGVPLLKGCRRSFIAGLGLFGLLLLFVAGCMLLGVRFAPFRYYMMFFTAIHAVPQVVIAAVLFWAFLQWEMRPNRFVNAVASTALAVYLIHENKALREWMWSDVVRVQACVFEAWMPLHAIFWALVIFAVCAAVDLLRQRFIDPLWLRLIDRIPPVRRELERAARR